MSSGLLSRRKPLQLVAHVFRLMPHRDYACTLTGEVPTHNLLVSSSLNVWDQQRTYSRGFAFPLRRHVQ